MQRSSITRPDSSQIERLEGRFLLTAAVDAALAHTGLVQFLLTDHQSLTQPKTHAATAPAQTPPLKQKVKVAPAAKTKAKPAAKPKTATAKSTTAKTTKPAASAKTTTTTATGKKTTSTAATTTTGIKSATSPSSTTLSGSDFTTAAAQSLVLGQQAGAQNNTQFHGDAARSGFDKNETQLNPTNVSSSFGQVWQSPALDGAVYATPLYADSILIQDAVAGVNGNLPNHTGDGIQNAAYAGKSLGVAFVGTGGGTVYAIATGDTNGTTGIAPGSILWKTKLGASYDSIDGNAIGVLGTPIIDLKAGRIYVCASVTDYLLKAGNPDFSAYAGQQNFEVFALNLSDGSLISGWPVVLSQAKLDAVNQNNLVIGPAVFLNGVSTTSGSTTVTCASTANLKVGMGITGNNIPATTTITAINANGTSFTISKSATGSASGFYIANYIAFVATGNGADQRGALNLSADGSTLYVDFACYGTSNPGWLTTVATGVTNGVANSQTAGLISSYSAIDTDGVQTAGEGGMWGAGGPAIDPAGNVFVTTGDTPGSTGAAVGAWGNSVLEFAPGQTLTLTGAYTPWNYQAQDTIDSDLGGGSPIIVTLPAGSSTTTDLLAEGGKQGNGYLVDAGNHLNNPTPVPTGGYINNGTVNASYPADLTVRPPTGLMPDQDASLYDTNPADVGNPAAGIPAAYRTYFTTTTSPYTPLPAQPGPLALFGPYNEQSASLNTAKARDTPSTFVGPDGTTYVIFNGASKSSVGSSTPVAPSVVLTKVVAVAGQPAYLQVVASNTAVFANPGAGVITGDGTANEIYWIVDEGAQRGDSTTSFSDGGPMLYAFNALTMQPLWSSAFEELSFPFGKYNSLTMEHGDAIVATNKLQAFGLTSDTIVDDSVTGTGTNQFNYTGSGWSHITGSSTIGTFQGTVSKDSTAGDSATLSFTGSQIKVYANQVTGFGSATFTVDGGSSSTVALTPSVSSANGLGSGDVLVYTASGLGAGTHTLKILNASGTIDVDRVEITPPVTTHAALSVSMTDGGTIPNPGDVIPYTITFDNAGSIFNNTGTAASSVTLNETIQANTTADLANSTPGWTLVSGSGGAGSVYSFAAGSLPAGQTGSVVFSVELNTSVPPGTTSVANKVQISDAAGDSAASTRSTPIPPAAAVKLIFTQQPPSNGGAGLPFSNAPAVTIEDQFGNPYTIGSSVVTLTLSSGAFVGGSTTATASTSNGVATFPNLEIGAGGTYTLTANDGMLTQAVSSSIIISNTAKLGFTEQPTGTAAGTPMNTVVVSEEDANGNPVTTDSSSTVTLMLSNHASFSDGSTSETAQVSNGAASFSGLTINASGDYTLQATDAALTAATSNNFHIGANASQLVFTQQPENTNAGQAVNPAMTVAFEDGFGNLDDTQNGSVTLTLNGGTLFGGGTSETVNAVSGVATFNNVVVPAAGNYTLTASASGVATGTSTQFTIGTRTLTHIDDTVGAQVAYIGGTGGNHWIPSSTSLAGNFDGTLTTDDFGGGGGDGGDTATFTFSGTMATLYAVVGPSEGHMQVFIDGGDPASVIPQVDLTNPAFNPQNAAQAIAPVFSTPLLVAGTHTIQVYVTGGEVSIDQLVVGPATPTVRWTPPADLTFGSPLNTTQLDAFTYDNVPNPPNSNFNVPGTFTYTPAVGTVLGVGQGQTLSATFVPSSAADPNGTGNQTYAAEYNGTGTSTTINVVQATPTISWMGPDNDMFFGQAIGPNQLNATATVNGVTVQGTFQYFVDDADGNPTIPAEGVQPPTGEDFDISLIFTPADSVDYATVTADSDVDVDPAVPVLVWSNPADITDGTPLSGAQLNAQAFDPTTNAPLSGNFTYGPLAGTVLSPGQHQQLTASFVPDDLNDYGQTSIAAYINVNYGAAAKLVFSQQPTATRSNVAISPAVEVAVEDSVGSIIPTNTDTITLTLGSGTFSDGQTSESATAVNGIANFSNLTITTNGIYSLTATTTDSLTGLITSQPSSQFNVGSSVYDNFNNGSTSLTNATAPFTTPFYLDYQTSSQATGTDTAGNSNKALNGPALTWTAGTGVGDGDLGTAGGAIVVGTGTMDESAIYTPTTISLADGAVHTVSMFITAATGLTGGTGDRNQIGFVTSPTAAFNGGFSFLSTKIYPDDSVQFQSGDGANGTGTGTQYVPTGVKANDWLQVIFTAKEITSGSFSGTISIEDYGQNGTATIPTQVLAPSAWSATTLSTIGTGSVMYGGFRTGTGGEQTSPLKFDNFAVDQPPHITAYLQAPPSTLTAGVPIATPVIVAVEDSNGAIVAGDTSTISITLTNSTFVSSGTAALSAVAVNGIATFNNVAVNPILDGLAVHGLTIRTADSTQLDESFSPETLTNPATQLGFIQPPANTNAGTAMTPVTVALQDVQGATITTNQAASITLTLTGGTFAGGGTTTSATVVNGVATFNNLVINNPGTTYTLTPSDSTDAVSGPASSAFTITDVASGIKFLQQPTSTTIGTAISPAVTVAITDPAGNTFTGDSSSIVTLALAGGTFSGGGTTVTGNVTNGIATFSNLVFSAAGSNLTLTASDPTVSGAPVSNIFSVADAPAKLGFIAQPANTNAGSTMPAVTVAIQDAGGNTVPINTSTVTLTLSSGTFSTGLNTASVAAVNGVATFSNLIINNAANGYTLAASDSPLTSATSNAFNIVSASPAQLAFQVQPSNAGAGKAISPAVVVAVQTSSGSVAMSDASTVTLTLTGGTFSGGGTTVTATASSGLATFGNLTINTLGAYTLTASDSNGAVTSKVSNAFAVTPAPTNLNFNNGATDYSSNFAESQQTGNDTLGWVSGSGINDQAAGAAGGGLVNSGALATDETAIYSPGTVNLSDHQIHTTSEFVTNVTTGSTSDKLLQLGFLTNGNTNFNQGNSFLSARIYSNDGVEFQYGNATGNSVTALGSTSFSAAGNDWLQLVLTAQETSAGNFNGTFSVLDYGKSGTASPTVVLAPQAWSITSQAELGTGSGMSPGFRTQTTPGFSGKLAFDNFSVSPNYGTVSIDDSVTGSGIDQITYNNGSGSWTAGNFTQTAGQLPAYASATGAASQHTSSTNNSTANTTITFAGTEILYYATETSSRGFANVSVSNTNGNGTGTASATVDENSLDLATPNAGDGVGDVLVYDSGVLPYGNHTLTVSVGARSNGARGISVDRFDVITGQPTVTWTAPAAITYGTALSATQLNATATFGGNSLAGTVVYSQPVGTILNAGAGQTLSAIFVPSVTSTFSEVPLSNAITVNANATTTALASSATPAPFGQAVSFTATIAPVSAIAAGALLPSGTVQFKIGGINFGSPVTLVNGVATSGLTSSLPSGNSTITAVYTPDTGNYLTSTSSNFTQQVRTVISASSINAGAAQRSMVNTIALTFTQNIASLDAGAFTLTTSTGGAVANVTITPVIAGNVVTLTFSGSAIVGGSLPDGRYIITANASAVHDASGLVMAANQTFSFFRFFGDSNGDATVNGTDYRAFFQAYLQTSPSAAYNPAFDVNNDGTINGTDYRAFFKNYLQTLP